MGGEKAKRIFIILYSIKTFYLMSKYLKVKTLYDRIVTLSRQDQKALRNGAF